MCKLSNEAVTTWVFFQTQNSLLWRFVFLFCLLTGPWSTSKLSKDQKGNTWQGPCIIKSITFFFFEANWLISIRCLQKMLQWQRPYQHKCIVNMINLHWIRSLDHFQEKSAALEGTVAIQQKILLACMVHKTSSRNKK